LPTHLRLGLPSGLFPSDFLTDMDSKEIMFRDVDWIHMVQNETTGGPLWGRYRNLRQNFLSNWTTIIFWRTLLQIVSPYIIIFCNIIMAVISHGSEKWSLRWENNINHESGRKNVQENLYKSGGWSK
jgi:hypothetical protein